jgi:hypothetical protein
MENKIQKEPEMQSFLKIRGHHLYRFVELWQEISSIHSTSDIKDKFLTGEFYPTPNTLKAISTVAQRFIQNLEKSNNNEYSKDILGNTDKEKMIVTSELETQFHHFLFSDPKDEVIVTTDLDPICASCAQGNHCHVRQKFDEVLVKRISILSQRPIIVTKDGNKQTTISLFELRRLISQALLFG